MMLITTCRKPCANSRKLAKALLLCVPGSKATNRGKKSIDALVGDARASGFRRIAIIHERKGNPEKLEILRVSRTAWDWAEPIEIKGVQIKGVQIRDVLPAKSVNIAGRHKEKIADLFDIEAEADAETVIEAGDELVFKNNKEEIILKIKW